MRATSLAMGIAVASLLAGCALPGLPRATGPDYAQQVVGGAPFTDLVVQIDHAPGHAPSAAATTHLLDTLRNVTGKSVVTLEVRETLDDTPDKAWSVGELVAIEKSTRRHEHVAPVALLHVLYPAGSYNGSATVAGITISGTALGPATIFLDTLRDSGCLPTAATPLGQNIGLPVPQPQQALDDIERSTLLHEVGHAMGLVDNGLPMVQDHEDREKDPAKGGHSNDPKSVMYWNVDTCSGLRDALLHDGSIPDTFDGADRADMKAAGGK